MLPSYITNSTIDNQIIQFVPEGKKQKIITFDIKIDMVLFTYIEIYIYAKLLGK
jgi:hypothetical protein